METNKQQTHKYPASFTPTVHDPLIHFHLNLSIRVYKKEFEGFTAVNIKTSLLG
jgi:hypothetical protein